jgi:hypothetical protein
MPQDTHFCIISNSSALSLYTDIHAITRKKLSYEVAGNAAAL